MTPEQSGPRGPEASPESPQRGPEEGAGGGENPLRVE